MTKPKPEKRVAVERVRLYDAEHDRLTKPTWQPADPKLHTVYETRPNS